MSELDKPRVSPMLMRNLRRITVSDFNARIGNEVSNDFDSCFGGVLVEMG